MENEQKKSVRAEREEEILAFWQKNKIFEKTLEKDAPKGNYVFYDGPPFATGQIHYGHILGSTAKDVVGRYKTMQGFRVPRKWGWDCHGLPIENIVEKELGIAGHKEIEAFGLEQFVEHARSKVLQYENDWEKSVARIGRWVDFRGGYKTMDNTFIESVWWALSKVNEKGLLYEGVRVLPYCARCETPIANSEIAMDNSYKDISDLSVYVKFELEDEPGTFLLAWTTTPWTLPGNTAIAVNKDIEYVRLHYREDGNVNSNVTDLHFKKLIVSKKYLETAFSKHELSIGDQYVLNDRFFEIDSFLVGGDLLGKKYKPIFLYYKDVDIQNKENIWKVWHADFITTEKGTGIAHQAPAFGEEDFELAKKNNVPTIIHVDGQGEFVDAVSDMKGLPVKQKDTSEDKDAHMRTDIEVIRKLQENGAFFAKEKIVHSYPHCMRCDTPIIYYALPSWFVNIQKIKPELIKNAETLNWIPGHLKEGRFKNILENAPDWTISRNRFWASPLPIWKSSSGKMTMVKSLDDLKEKTKKSGNTYFVMRHGGTEGNEQGIVSYKNQAEDNLTSLGQEQVAKSAEALKEKNIDLIISSPFTRTRETTAIVQKILGLSDDQIVFRDELMEVNAGEFDGKSWDEYHRYVYNVNNEWFTHTIPGGESLSDVRVRTGKCLYDLEKEYAGKNILIVTHGGPAWLLFVNAGEYVPDGKEYKTADSHVFVPEFKRFDNAEVRELAFVPLPHNENFELDLHRPYIDAITLVDEKGEEYKRIPEVLDCWFESGSMPFAQDHYPFERPNWKEENFPAGFVAEYVAQTRTWFYYMLVISTILFDSAPFKHLITTGTLRASDGQKMSKRLKNYPDPFEFIDQYGVDALRMYLMASPLMKGEDANFDEKAVAGFKNKIIDKFINVLAFYELSRDKNLETSDFNAEDQASHVLDQWILARLHQTYEKTNTAMEAYDLAEAIRPFELFMDDFSSWYLRRSRDRLREGDESAKRTLYFLMRQITLMLAPFTPFVAEDIWQKLKTGNDEESVHLAKWPEVSEIVGKLKILSNMETVRAIVTKGLELRQKAGIKIRQPLQSLSFEAIDLEAYHDIIKDELNVKEIVTGDFTLDTVITPELKKEGDYRELVRALQDLRKKEGLQPSDRVTFTVETNDAGKELMGVSDLAKEVGATEFVFESNDGAAIAFDDYVFKVKVER